MLKRQLTFPFWKEKLRLELTFSLQNGIQKIPGEKGKNKGKRPNRNGDGHLTKQLTTNHILLMNINRIIISGNLVASPTLRETNSGTPVASVTIANNEFFYDGEGERQQVTTLVDATVRDKSGENFASLAKKGHEVIIEDQLRRNDWESEEVAEPASERT